nr:unnamed protein product [Spirometra erinaceieuropaei]
MSLHASIKPALETIKTHCASEKWQFLLLSTIETLGILESETEVGKLPTYKVREKILASLQMALESSNPKLNQDALDGFEAFLNCDELYDERDTPTEETHLTFQFIGAVWPCNVFSESLQANLLKLLLKLGLSQRDCLNMRSMLSIIQICIDTFIKFNSGHGKDAVAAARTTLTQVLEAFVLKKRGLSPKELPPQSVQLVFASPPQPDSPISELELQVLGVLKYLTDQLLPENITSHNRAALPLYLEAIRTVVSLLPISIVGQRAFLNILWQRLCPALMRLLRNQKEEKCLTSTCGTETAVTGDLNRGSACSIAPPDSDADSCRIIYAIFVHLTLLVGSIQELRPMLESVYHRMLLYPPINHRHDAISAITKLLSRPEGVICVTGPLYSMPSLRGIGFEQDEDADCDVESGDQPSRTRDNSHSRDNSQTSLKPSFRLLSIILDSLHACSSITSNYRLICASVKCSAAIISSLSALSKGEGLDCELIGPIEGQFGKPSQPVDSPAHRSPPSSLSRLQRTVSLSPSEMSIDTSLPRSLDVDRWAAHDFLLSLMKVVSSLVNAQSVQEIDEILISFSSNYCAGKRSSASDRIFGSADVCALPDAPINDPAGTLLNADAVYAASIAALALNYRLLEAGFYARSSSQLAGSIMREEQFLNSLLGAGLLLYVSEAWVSQVYRGICKQDILSIGGLVPGDQAGNQRGACLIKFLTDYDGINWRPESPPMESKSTSGAALTSAGCRLVSSILDFGWDPLVETLTNAVAAAGMKVSDRDSLRSLGPQFAKVFTGSRQGPAAIFMSRLSIQIYLFCLGQVGCRSTSISWVVQPASAEDPVAKKSFASSSFSFFVSLMSGDFSASAKHSRAAELGAALLNSLLSLQDLARLACRLGGADGLQSRCGRVFALLLETTRVATAADCAGSRRRRRRLHAASVLSLDAILSSALELGCQCTDCWVHLFRACELVDELEYAHFSTDGASAGAAAHPTECRFGATSSLQELVSDFCRQNSGDTGISAGIGGLLTEEQTGCVLGHLSQSVDRIFEESTDHLPLPVLLAFLDSLLQVSIANISSRHLLPISEDGGGGASASAKRSKSLPVLGRQPSALSNSFAQGAAALAAKIRGLATESTRQGAGNTKISPLLFDRLAQLLLHAIRSTDRPLLHLLLLWMPASQHFVDACCFSTAATAPPALPPDASAGGGDRVDQAQQLFVSHRALSHLHECIIALVSARPELPYFSANEMFCKPFELLLRLEMCDGELQDRIICCISEVVEAGSSCLHSGWRPVFAALRSIKVAFLVEGQSNPLDGVAAAGSNRTTAQAPSLGVLEGAAGEQTEELNLKKVDFVDETTAAATTRDSTTSRQRISTVLEIFEIFLTAKDLMVFCEIAVDCVRCLLRYLSAGELQSTSYWDSVDGFASESHDAVEADANPATAAAVANETTGATPAATNAEDGLASSLDMRSSSTSEADDFSRVEASCSLCLSTLPLLTRCCEVLQALWSSGLNHVIRFARRHAHLASGGAPQFNFLPNIRSCASRPLQDRIKLIAPWFSVQRLMEPTFVTTEEPSKSPKLWSLLSLDELDQPSGVLHLWLLLLDGVITASWQCNPRVQRSVFEEFADMLHLAVRGLSEESCQARVTCVSRSVEEVVSSAAQEKGDGEEHTLAVLIGPTFAVFVINHVLMPKLQIAIDEFAASTMQGQVSLPNGVQQGGLSISHDKLLLSKLCLLIGQTTQLIGSLFSRFQSSGNADRVVGLDLMLHQTLRILVECASLRNEKLSRLSISCFRHLMLSISARLTPLQWDLAANHFEEVFRVCLFPLHTLTTVHEATARRSPTSVPAGDTSGLQVANLRPVVTASETEGRDRLRQLTLHLFQLEEQRQICADEAPTDVASPSGDADDSSVSMQPGSQVLTFDLSVYPLSTCSLERPPVETLDCDAAGKPNRRLSQKLDSIRDLFHVKSSRSAGSRKVSSPPLRRTSDASTSTLRPDDQGMQDAEARRCCTAQLLAAMSDSFLAYANPATGDPAAVPSLHAVFTENVARLIAVADHVSLRRALANWFLHIVSPSVGSPAVSAASVSS